MTHQAIETNTIERLSSLGNRTGQIIVQHTRIGDFYVREVPWNNGFEFTTEIELATEFSSVESKLAEYSRLEEESKVSYPEELKPVSYSIGLKSEIMVADHET